MQAPVIFDRVSKKFTRGERHNSLRDLIPSIVRQAFKPQPAGTLGGQEFWAVRDVSFELGRGQALGIIGPNGAGKSTTLKLLTRILKPTCGACAIRGRVGALIEVAAGFHPDLTGLENVFLQGAIMGMRRAEIASKLDAIIDFADLAGFVDTPVKRYSSGMNARLGFSIAAHLSPDVLIIDEVLSVGDMRFQQRCFDRMSEFRRDGVTIVLVSHNLQAVAGLCDQALYLDRTARAIGPTATVIEQYVTSSTDPDVDAPMEFAAEQLRLADTSGVTRDTVKPGTPLCLDVSWRVHQSTAHVTFGFRIYRSTDGLLVFDGHVSDAELGLHRCQVGDVIDLSFEFRPHLVRGQYHIEVVASHSPTHTLLGRACPAGAFRVSESRTHRGIADVELAGRASLHRLPHRREEAATNVVRS